MELIEALPRDRFEPFVLLHRPGPLMQYLRDRHVEFMECPELPVAEANGSLGRAMKVASGLFRLVRFLRRNRIDIVHTNDWRMHVTWLFAARAAGAAHIWHQRTKWAPRRFVLPVRLASRILVISEFCRDALPTALRDRAEIVWNPVELVHAPDRRVARQTIRKQFNLPSTSQIVAFVGNFSHQKRPEVFVQIACALAARSDDDLRFLMFGEAREPHATSVQELVNASGLENKVLAVGPKHPIYSWLVGCDVLVAPALREAFGRSLVEAMLCAVPVIAADHGGHREIVRHGETGYLISPENITAFAERIQALLQNPQETKKMTDVAYKDARRRFSGDRHAQDMVAIYESSAERI